MRPIWAAAVLGAVVCLNACASVSSPPRTPAASPSVIPTPTATIRAAANPTATALPEAAIDPRRLAAGGRDLRGQTLTVVGIVSRVQDVSGRTQVHVQALLPDRSGRTEAIAVEVVPVTSMILQQDCYLLNGVATGETPIVMQANHFVRVGNRC